MKGPEGVYRVIQVIDGQLVTKETSHFLTTNENGEIQNDVENDVCFLFERSTSKIADGGHEGGVRGDV